MQFTYANTTSIHFGQGSIAAITDLISRDRKILLVYGGGSIKRNGVYDQAVAALAEHNWQEFGGVEPNPTVETLNNAVELIRREGIDYILAVGGGSVADGCKYLAAAALYDGDGWDILTGAHKVTQALPLGVILTLPATGSESNTAAVITRKATQEKSAFMSPAVRPQFAVLDPDVMKTLPERQLANGIVDAYVHVCEQYLTYPCDAWVQDGYAEVLLRNLVKLAEKFQQRDTDAWRANLMWTANQALNGLVGAGVPQDWATHMIGHELTALYDIDHARTLSIVQPALLRSQIEAKRAKLEQLGRNVYGLADGADLAERSIDAIEQTFRSVGVPTRISDAGVDGAKAVGEIVSALEKHGMTALGERQAITPEISREILERAA